MNTTLTHLLKSCLDIPIDLETKKLIQKSIGNNICNPLDCISSKIRKQYKVQNIYFIDLESERAIFKSNNAYYITSFNFLHQILKTQKISNNKIVDFINKHGEVDTGNALDPTFNKETEDIPLSTKAIILNKNGEVLILKDSSTTWWDLPGGHIKEDETTEDGLIREVKEETGIILNKTEQLFAKELLLGKPPKKRIVIFFDSRIISDHVHLSSEHTDYKFIEKEEIDSFNLGVFGPILKEYFEEHLQKHHNIGIVGGGEPDQDTYQGVYPIIGISEESKKKEEERKKKGELHNHPVPISREQKPIMGSGDRFGRVEPRNPSMAFGSGAQVGTGPASTSQIWVRSEDILKCLKSKIENIGYTIKSINAFENDLICFTDNNGNNFHVMLRKDSHDIESIFRIINKQDSSIGVLTTATTFTPTYGGTNKKKVEKSEVQLPLIESTKAETIKDKSFIVDKDSKKDKPIETPINISPIISSLEKHIVVPAEKLRQGKIVNDSTIDYINLELKKSIDTLQDSNILEGITFLTKNYDRVENSKKMYLYGIMSLCIKDKEGHLIECNALKSAVDKFLNSGYPMVQLFHSNIPIGKVIPSFITEDGKVYKTHVDNIAAYAVIEMRSDIEVSHKAMEEICKGNLRAFSISGNSSKKHPKCTENGCYWSISDLEIYECTICVPGDTEVITNNGLRSIKDINIGDKVLSHKGNFQKVTKIMNRYINEEIYRIWINNKFINITGEHPILIQQKGLKYWINASKLKVDDDVLAIKN